MRRLELWVDESGQYSLNDETSEYYLVGMVFHETESDLGAETDRLNDGLAHLGVANVQIHAGPLIRRKYDFNMMNIEWRKKIFNTMFSYLRKIDIRYKTIAVEKKHARDDAHFTALLSKKLYSFLMDNLEQFTGYDEVVIFYDNAQNELKRVIVSIFGSVLNNVDYATVEPINSRLFQVADMCVTLELLALKLEEKQLTKSELHFFESEKKLRKSYLKALRLKEFT